jgi:hypothetical protein
MAYREWMQNRINHAGATLTRYSRGYIGRCRFRELRELKRAADKRAAELEAQHKFFLAVMGSR